MYTLSTFLIWLARKIFSKGTAAFLIDNKPKAKLNYTKTSKFNVWKYFFPTGCGGLPVRPVWGDGAAAGSGAVGEEAECAGKVQGRSQAHHQGSGAPFLLVLKAGWREVVSLCGSPACQMTTTKKKQKTKKEQKQKTRTKDSFMSGKNNLIHNLSI